jgi:hypothetical protein
MFKVQGGNRAAGPGFGRIAGAGRHPHLLLRPATAVRGMSGLLLRAKGFAEAGIADPLLERFREISS